MTLTEEEQARALREVLAALDTARRADRAVADAVSRARSAGVSVNRLASVANVSRTKVDAWLKQASTSEKQPQVKRPDA